MVKDAEANADADKKKREAVDARNEADSLVYQTEKTLKEAGDKVSAADKEKIQSACADLKKALEGDNVEEIKAKSEALKQASYKMAEEMYKAQAAAQGANPGADPNAGANAGNAGAGNAGAGSSSGFDKGTADDVEYEVHDN